MRITESELLEALRDASRRSGADDSGALTSHELADALGVSHVTVLVYLKRVKRAGQLEVVRINREGVDGRVSPVTGYRVKPTGKKKAA